MENIRENYESEAQTTSEPERKQYEIPSVDNALTNLLSLPQVVKDVSHIHKGHTLEIRKQQQTLETVQKQLKLVEQKEKKNAEALASITRQLHLSEEETQRTQQTCNQYKKEMTDLLKECQSQASIRFHLKKNIKEEKWEQDKCRKKVVRCQDVIKEMKTASEDEVSLKEMRHQVEALQRQWQEIQQNEDKETILNGTAIQRCEEEYEELKLQEKMNEEKIQAAKDKVENLKAEIKQTEQSTYVLYKRNKAQLTRLKRELKELTSQFGQWKERLTHLQQQISNLHQQI